MAVHRIRPEGIARVSLVSPVPFNDQIAGRSGAVVKLGRAFAAAKDEAGVLLTGTGVLIVTAGLGMFHLEHDAQPAVFDSVLDGLWWAVITLTTVGYGDVYPVTAAGRVLATVAMFAGIGVIGAACGIMADALREISGVANAGRMNGAEEGSK